MKRVVIVGNSEEGYRSVVVVDAVQPHLSIRDAIDAALISDIIGNDTQIRTYDLDDGHPAHCTPQDVDKAAEALDAAHKLVDDGDNAAALTALEDALEALGRRASA